MPSYHNGLNFVLCGGSEHRSFRISQLCFKSVPNPERPGELDVVENRTGSSKQLNLQNKTIVRYARPGMGERCHVHLLKLYLQKHPRLAHERDIFYWKAKGKIPAEADCPWFFNSPVGHYT